MDATPANRRNTMTDTAAEFTWDIPAKATPTRVILSVDNNRGYAADQITATTTLADLLVMIENAIEEHGEDAIVVTQDKGNRYGANFGGLDPYDDIVAADDDEDEDEDSDD